MALGVGLVEITLYHVLVAVPRHQSGRRRPVRSIEQQEFVGGQPAHASRRPVRSAKAGPPAVDRKAGIDQRRDHGQGSKAAPQQRTGVAHVDIGVHRSELGEAKAEEHRVGIRISECENRVKLA